MALKIVILGPAHPFRGGGITTFNERLARELVEQGHDVSILNFTVQYPSFLFPGKSQVTEEPAPAGIRIERKLHSMNPVNWLFTGRYLADKKPDLVIVRYWLPLMGPAFGTVLRLVKRNRHTRVLAITDNVQPHEKRIGDRLFTSWFLKPCDGFITMSEKVLGDLRKFRVSQPVITIDHPLYDNFGAGVDKNAARLWLKIDPRKKLLLFFGFIRKYKGLDLLLEAMKEVKDPEAVLLVAGEFYEDEGGYQSQIDRLGIRNRVILKNDFIPNEEVKYYFSAADVVVQPYRNATQSGVTPLAYHFEKPMIVTNVGALPDYVPDGLTGIVTQPEPGALAKAIAEFLQFGEDHYKSQIRILKQKFSWHSFAQSLLDLFRSLSKDKPYAGKDQ